MKTLTIQITDEQEKFLKEFAAKQYDGAKDNVGTRDPIHFVQTKRERVVDANYSDVDKTVYILYDDCGESYDSSKEMIEAYYERQGEECPIEIVSYDEAYAMDEFIDVEGEERVICEEDDYIEAYGLKKDKDWYSVDIEYYYEDVALFFILDEARKYKQYQGHNLCEPRTYTKSPGYSNGGDFVPFRNLLMSIGKQLNEEEKKDDV